MKHLTRTLIAAGMIALTACSAQADAPPKDLKANLAKKIGQPVDSVRETPIKGLYEVVLNKRHIVYSDAKGEFVVVGDMVNVATKKSLTEARMAELNKVDFAKLPLADAIKEVRGNGSRKLVVFSDPDCPFCKRLETQSLAGIENITIYTFLMPLAGLHPDAARKSELIWCSENPQKAWSEFMHNGNLPTGGKTTCDNPIARSVKLGESLGINGTPALIFADGQIVSGAIPKDEIEKILATQK
ncbi:DsbC family protein [Deefgea piscis]|uniref:Thiol:disulfide interchange protein n=1 Tax=Deefgea piscis TaxID=2739061 RepID=A0A6M8SUN5_9NEIS|nr:DsbC family protein [Deefgea piscis]QKJ67050.1 DsbC family protein [Deefgea piscis]